MSLFTCFDISSSGMTAERRRLEVLANNIANAGTTQTAEGGPFRRQVLLTRPVETPASPFSPASSRGSGVEISGVVEDGAPPRMVYDPGHPQADADGMVQYPNFDIVNEMINLILATRSYQANLNVFNEAKNMLIHTLDIGR